MYYLFNTHIDNTYSNTFQHTTTHEQIHQPIDRYTNPPHTNSITHAQHANLYTHTFTTRKLSFNTHPNKTTPLKKLNSLTSANIQIHQQLPTYGCTNPSHTNNTRHAQPINLYTYTINIQNYSLNKHLNNITPPKKLSSWTTDIQIHQQPDHAQATSTKKWVRVKNLGPQIAGGVQKIGSKTVHVTNMSACPLVLCTRNCQREGGVSGGESFL